MTVELSELSLHLDDFIKKVQAGEFVVIRDGDTEVAEVRPLTKVQHPSSDAEIAEFPLLTIDSSVSDIDELRSSEPRPFGLDEGAFEVTDAFFEPLPEDLLAAFNGETPDPLLDSDHSK